MSKTIVIPYRNRAEHLNKFVPHMLSYLPNDVNIYVIEQCDDKPFNRGKLLNVGFAEANVEHSECVIMHDIDMLPLTVDYSPSHVPTHLADAIEQFNWVMPCENYFGGVVQFPADVFKRINGYSNDYWGWGAEDDDIFFRCLYNKIPIHRREGRMISLPHPINGWGAEGGCPPEVMANSVRLNMIRQVNPQNFLTDGLTSLDHVVLRRVKMSGYMHIMVAL